MDRTYVCIDLKSYYASVELADRKYNPLTTNLVVADPTRTEKTICLAVSPSLKAHGISGRARLFEVVQRVKEVNAERFRRARKLGVLPKGEDGNYHFTSASFDAERHPADTAPLHQSTAGTPVPPYHSRPACSIGDYLRSSPPSGRSSSFPLP